MSATLAQVSQQALRGDFKTARRLLDRERNALSRPDADRIDAQDQSFRLDRAVAIAFVMTGAAILLIAALTLFR